MLTSDIEKASTFIQGFANRDGELAIKYIDPGKYLEHNPRVADGVDSLKSYVDRIPDENPRLEVLRIFRDGAFVVTQAQGSVFGRSVFFDVFRFEGGLIAEHWTFSTVAGHPNKSGHTQADGPTEPIRLEETENNKALVREYYEAVHLRGEHNKILLYFSGDRCIRHEPGVADGVGAFTRDLEWLSRTRSIDEITLLLGQGDFVFIAAKGSTDKRPCIYIDLYRVEADKIVEHWGFPEEPPPPLAWENHNGML